MQAGDTELIHRCVTRQPQTPILLFAALSEGSRGCPIRLRRYTPILTESRFPPLIAVGWPRIHAGPSAHTQEAWGENLIHAG